jgi:hypothetical protein
VLNVGEPAEMSVRQVAWMMVGAQWLEGGWSMGIREATLMDYDSRRVSNR